MRITANRIAAIAIRDSALPEKDCDALWIRTPCIPPPGRRLEPHALAALGYLALSLVLSAAIWRVFGTHIAPEPGRPALQPRCSSGACTRCGSGCPTSGTCRSSSRPRRHDLLGPPARRPRRSAPSSRRRSRIPGGGLQPLLLGSFVLCGWTTWYVLRRSGLGARRRSSAAASSPSRRSAGTRSSHLQILLMQLDPADALDLGPAARRRRPGAGRPSSSSSTFHVTGGSYLAYMIHSPC